MKKKKVSISKKPVIFLFNEKTGNKRNFRSQKKATEFLEKCEKLEENINYLIGLSYWKIGKELIDEIIKKLKQEAKELLQKGEDKLALLNYGMVKTEKTFEEIKIINKGKEILEGILE